MSKRFFFLDWNIERDPLIFGPPPLPPVTLAQARGFEYHRRHVESGQAWSVHCPECAQRPKPE